MRAWKAEEEEVEPKEGRVEVEAEVDVVVVREVIGAVERDFELGLDLELRVCRVRERGRNGRRWV